MPHRYRRRLIDDFLDAVFTPSGLAAVMLVGPRGCGKTTTASRRATNTVRLDQPAIARSFAADPDALLTTLETPVLVDEWQEVAASMSAVKRAVDGGTGGGRFLITGSVRARRTGESWPGTGRVVPVRMYGLTEAEVEESRSLSGAVTRLFQLEDPISGIAKNEPNILDYITRITRGTFPDVLNLNSTARSAWYGGYVDQLIHRDVSMLAEVRNPKQLENLVRAIAATTSRTATIRTLAEAAGIDSRTASSYIDLLVDLGVVVRIPAWHHNELKRLTRAPKLYLADTAMAAHLMRRKAAEIAWDGALLGNLIETFTAMQLIPSAALNEPDITVSHLRMEGGAREVDLVLEGPTGVVGVEVKAGSEVADHDARHLVWLRDQLGSQFHRGFVLHTGASTFPISDRIWAMPISSLWNEMN